MKKILLIPSLLTASIIPSITCVSCNEPEPTPPQPVEKITISFEAGFGGKISGEKTLEIDKGSKWGNVNKPNLTFYNNYRLDGWYIGNDKLNDESIIDSEVTIKAKFTDTQPYLYFHEYFPTPLRTVVHWEATKVGSQYIRNIFNTYVDLRCSGQSFHISGHINWTEYSEEKTEYLRYEYIHYGTGDYWDDYDVQLYSSGYNLPSVNKEYEGTGCVEARYMDLTAKWEFQLIIDKKPD